MVRWRHLASLRDLAPGGTSRGAARSYALTWFAPGSRLACCMTKWDSDIILSVFVLVIIFERKRRYKLTDVTQATNEKPNNILNQDYTQT